MVAMISVSSSSSSIFYGVNAGILLPFIAILRFDTGEIKVNCLSSYIADN